MSRRWMIASLLALGIAGASAAVVRAEEDNEVKVKIEDVPAAVRATLVRESAGAKEPIKSVDKETGKKEKKVVYEADVVIDGKNYEIKVAEDGSLISKKLDEEEDEKDAKDKKEKK
jgi:hypothetical protein